MKLFYLHCSYKKVVEKLNEENFKVIEKSLRNGVPFVQRGWRGWRASVRGVGDVLMWVAWVAWLHWWRASMCSVDRVGGMLAWVAWWHAINIVIVIIEILS